MGDLFFLRQNYWEPLFNFQRGKKYPKFAELAKEANASAR